MKVRWTTGSIRFRISPQELAALTHGLDVSLELDLPGAILIAALRPTDGATAILADSNTIILHLSDSDCKKLAEPDIEGVYFLTNSEPAVRYFVEKDFPCVHRGAPEALEVESETFTPPKGFRARHGAH